MCDEGCRRTLYARTMLSIIVKHYEDTSVEGELKLLSIAWLTLTEH